MWLDACVLIPADNLPILAGIQPAEIRRSGAILSLARRAIERGHLFHSALTCTSSADARRLKSRHPFAPAAQQLISSSDSNHIRVVQWADHQWNPEWADNPTRLRIFIPDTRTNLSSPEWPSQEEPGSGLTASAPVSDVSIPACINGVWPPLRPVSVVQKNKPSTLLSSDVLSIDLLMDCTAWRFFTMRQSNCCSTPAPRSRAAKQWLEELSQKTKNVNNISLTPLPLS